MDRIEKALKRKDEGKAKAAAPKPEDDADAVSPIEAAIAKRSGVRVGVDVGAGPGTETSMRAASETASGSNSGPNSGPKSATTSESASPASEGPAAPVAQPAQAAATTPSDPAPQAVVQPGAVSAPQAASAAAQQTAETATPTSGWDAATPQEPKPNKRKDQSKIAYTQTRVVHINPAVLEENRIVAHDKMDLRSLAYDQLRTHVLQTMDENGWRTLAVTSPTPMCGKTVTAINLAYSISYLADQTVLLADFDLRRPSVAQYMGIPEGPGLSDYLNGKEQLADCLVNPSAERLVVLPSFHPLGNASELLAADGTRALVRDIRRRYNNRKIVFDLPPILTTDDVQAFLPAVDCVLLVVASGSSKANEVRMARRLLAKHNLVGAVMNYGELEMTGYY